MDLSTHVSPEDVLAGLLNRKSRPQRTKNLELINKICAAELETKGKISVSRVGRLCEALGGIKARAIYNSTSEDYRTLIQSWANKQETFDPDSIASKGLKSTEQYLLRIEDPALRSVIQAVFHEREQLRSELNLLKTITLLKVDRTMRRETIESSGTASPEPLTNDFILTGSERAALAQVVNETFLSDEGWAEGTHGEIVNDLGRTIFDVGFTHAIRKALASQAIRR
jgi:hypothetical protein